MPKAKREGYIRIDKIRCKGCGLCAAACPVKGIRLADEVDHRGIRTARPEAAGRCTACGACYHVCPDVAVAVYKVSSKKN